MRAVGRRAGETIHQPHPQDRDHNSESYAGERTEDGVQAAHGLLSRRATTLGGNRSATGTRQSRRIRTRSMGFLSSRRDGSSETSPQGLPTGAESAGEERWASSRRARGRNDKCRRPSVPGENSWASARVAQASAAHAAASARFSAAASSRRLFPRPGLLGGLGRGRRRSDGGGAARQASHCQHHREERSQPPRPAATGLICRGAPPPRLVGGRWQQRHRISGQRGHQPKVSPAPRGHDYGPKGRDDVGRVVGYSPSWATVPSAGPVHLVTAPHSPTTMVKLERFHRTLRAE